MTLLQMRSLRPLLLLLVTQGLALAQGAPSQLPPERIAKAEAAISASMSRQSIAGLSIAVVSDGEVRWANGYGFADLENFVPFTATTVWRLGSVSKPITAVAAMQLAERGKLDLDAPIQSYCPAFPEKPQPITPRQLLGHLAGIRHYGPNENFNSTRHWRSVGESLDSFKNDPLLHPPGTAHVYTTYGYVVLGCVIEGASGMKYADYVRDNVAGPAGMVRTRTDDLYAIVPNRARGYAKQEDGRLGNADLADTSNKVPGGGMVSTAVDLGRFAIGLESNKLLKKETFEAMQVPMKLSDGKPSNYFGWSIVDRAGDRMLTHSGSQQGTATYLLMVPAKGFAVAVIAQTPRASTSRDREAAHGDLPAVTGWLFSGTRRLVWSCGSAPIARFLLLADELLVTVAARGDRSLSAATRGLPPCNGIAGVPFPLCPAPTISLPAVVCRKCVPSRGPSDDEERNGARNRCRGARRRPATWAVSACLVVAGLAGVVALLAAAPAARPRPSFLLLVVDTLRSDGGMPEARARPRSRAT